MSNEPQRRYAHPLFRGATRVPTIKGGVPTRAFVWVVAITVFIAMFVRPWGWLVFPPLYVMVAVISRNDDRTFWTLELWIRTKLLNSKRHWGAVSFTPTPYGRRRRWRRHCGGFLHG